MDLHFWNIIIEKEDCIQGDQVRSYDRGMREEEEAMA